MTRIINALADIAAPYDVLYCDLWGCLHDGKQLYPAAVAALRDFRARGGAVALMTNAPRTQGAVRRRLERMGLPRDAWDVIVASGDATQEAMLMGVAGRRLWHIGPGKDDDLFNDIPAALADQPPIERVALDQAEGIICSGPFDEFNDAPDDYRGRFLAAKTRGLKMLNANPDLVVDHGETRIICAGTLAQLYEDMGGEVLSFGKPHPPIYDLARRRLAATGGEVAADRILALGDGIGTDVQGAIAEDIDVVFISGGLAAGETGTPPGPDGQPDPEKLSGFIAGKGLAPTYVMGFLR